MTADEMLDRERIGCWCEQARKPCEYHQGMVDALDLLEQRGWVVVRGEPERPLDAFLTQVAHDVTR